MASARSMAMYCVVRFSSLQTARMASLLKMPWKMLLSMMLAAMRSF